MPEIFMLDAQQLEANYFAAQRDFHPDRTGSSFDALQQAAAINDAYTALKDPFTRALHLLALQDIHPLQEGNNTYSTPALLQQTFALREELMEAHTPELLAEVEAGCAAHQADTHLAMTQAAQEKNWRLLAEAVVKMQFLRRFNDEVRRAAEKMKAAHHA